MLKHPRGIYLEKKKYILTECIKGYLEDTCTELIGLVSLVAWSCSELTPWLAGLGPLAHFCHNYALERVLLVGVVPQIGAQKKMEMIGSRVGRL